LDEFTLRVAREFRDRLRAALGGALRGVSVFGSRARGDGAPDSDLDVLVLVAARRGDVADRAYEAALDVGLANGIYISPRVIAAADFDSRQWAVIPFIRNVKREGIAV
jgi:predicted nucleotidyltransferase